MTFQATCRAALANTMLTDDDRIVCEYLAEMAPDHRLIAAEREVIDRAAAALAKLPTVPAPFTDPRLTKRERKMMDGMSHAKRARFLAAKIAEQS